MNMKANPTQKQYSQANATNDANCNNATNYKCDENFQSTVKDESSDNATIHDVKITESRGQHLSGSPGGEHSLGNQRGLNFSEIFQAFDPPFSQKPLATQNTVT